MAKYIVFPTKVWPLVVRSLRLRYKWPEHDLDHAISTAIDLLDEKKPDIAAVREQLLRAHDLVKPHPTNPGRWAWQVNVAESYAAAVTVVDSDTVSPVQSAALKELESTASYSPSHLGTRVVSEDEIDRSLVRAKSSDTLHGMNAAPQPE